MNGTLPLSPAKRRPRRAWLPALWGLLALLLAACAAAGNVVTWETASEVDTAGFNLYRGPGGDGPWTQVNEALIPPAADPVRGGAYEFVDEGAQPGQVYYYQLEEVELDGSANRYPPTQLQAPAVAPAWPWWLAAALLALGVGWWLGSRRGERPPGP